MPVGRSVSLNSAKHIITHISRDTDGSRVPLASSDGCRPDIVNHQINGEKNDFLMIVCEYLIRIVIDDAYL